MKNKFVWIYERETDAIRVFVSEDAAMAWLKANDPEGIAFEFDVTKFPVERVYPASIEGREIWAQVEPPSEMVWAVCPWMRQHNDESRCRRCPRYEEDPDFRPDAARMLWDG